MAEAGATNNIIANPSTTHARRQSNELISHPAKGATISPPADIPMVPNAIALPRSLMNHLDITAAPTMSPPIIVIARPTTIP